MIVFVDTSVLCNFLRVPGKSQHVSLVRDEFRKREQQGDRFVLPLSTIIETGNHISQLKPPRREIAERLDVLLRSIVADELPWSMNTAAVDDAFLEALAKGDSTGESMVDLVGSGRMGVGDLAIRVERDQFLERGAFRPSDVQVWSLDAELDARREQPHHRARGRIRRAPREDS